MKKNEATMQKNDNTGCHCSKETCLQTTNSEWQEIECWLCW